MGFVYKREMHTLILLYSLVYKVQNANNAYWK